MPLATLEEIRLLSNLETQHYKLLQIVLFGQPELDRNLSAPEIRQLKERITHSFALKPLTAAEIRDYLMFRLRAADYHGPDLFGPEVIKLIARASRGLTRRVNIIADKTLLAAFAENTHTLSAKHVRAAIEDSAFELPAGFVPWPKLAAAAALLALGTAVGAGLHAFLQAPPAKPLAPPVAAALVPPAARQAVAPDEAAQGAGQGDAAQGARHQANEGDMVAQRLAATETWLATQSPATSSIQLMVSNDPRQLRHHLRKISHEIEMEQIFVYRSKVNGQPAWTVLYGGFPDRAKTAAALDALPDSLKVYRPYLRTVQGVRAEIRQNQ